MFNLKMEFEVFFNSIHDWICLYFIFDVKIEHIQKKLEIDGNWNSQVENVDGIQARKGRGTNYNWITNEQYLGKTPHIKSFLYWIFHSTCIPMIMWR